jgi:hypothetical protein
MLSESRRMRGPSLQILSESRRMRGEGARAAIDHPNLQILSGGSWGTSCILHISPVVLNPN